MNERDTHFAGFARLQFPEINKLFFTMYARIMEHRPIEEIDAIEDEIRTLMAQHAYDLVAFALEEMNPISFQSYLTTHEIIEKEIPDLPAWPEQ